MKKSFLSLSLAACTSVLLTALPQCAFAANRYWDGNGATAGAGTTPTGTWGTSTFWTANSTGTAATGAWVSGDTAIFSAGTDATGTYTVTLSGTQTAAGVNIEEGTVTFGGTGAASIGAGTVNLSAGTLLSTDSSARIAITAGGGYVIGGNATLRTTNTGPAGSFVDADATISIPTAGVNLTIDYQVLNTNNIIQTASAISGAGNLIKTGGGVISIASTATYTGTTTISDGELRIRTTANRLPVGTAVTVNTPGILNLNAVAQQIGSLSGTGRVGLAGATLTVGDATNTTFSGVIEVTANAGAAGSTATGGGVTKVGAGTLTLTGANTYTGATTVNGGILQLGASDRLADVTAVTVGASGTLDMNGFNETVATIAGAGSITNGGNLTIAGATGTTFSGSMNVSTLSKTGAGTTTLSGNNTISNLNIASGIYTISGSNTVSTATNINGGRINFNNNNAVGTSVINVANVAGIEFTNSAPGITLANDVVLAAGGNAVTIYSTSGNQLTQTGVISGDRALLRTDTGAGTFTLAGDNTFTGGVTIRSRGLVVGHANGLGTGTLSLGDGTAPLNPITISASTALTGANAIDNAVTVNRDFTVGGTNNIEFSGAVTLAASSIATVSNTGTTTISGTIDGAGGLTKAGASTLTLSGANTYAGNTTVSAGTLLAKNTSGSATSSGNVTVDSGATLAVGDGGAAGAVSGNIADNGTVEFNRSDNTAYGGLVSGAGVLIKNGGGTLSLTNANTYGGGTTINAGTLQANNTTGSATGGGAVTVNTGGTLAGSGAVNGAVTVNGGGTLAPGTSIESLDIGASLTFNASSTFAAELNTNVSPTVGADLVNVNGALSILAGAVLSLVDLNTAYAGETKFTLISYAGTWDNGIFVGRDDDSFVTVGANTYVINYNDTASGANSGGGAYGNYLTLTAVPEASAFVFGGLACVVVGLIQVRRLLSRRQAVC